MPKRAIMDHAAVVILQHTHFRLKIHLSAYFRCHIIFIYNHRCLSHVVIFPKIYIRGRQFYLPDCYNYQTYP